jgi:uncharacterized membrane protein YfcA
MTAVDALAILVAGIGAGALNAVVGSGSLITFPTLLALGYPPVVANVSNTIGLVPGGVSAAVGYRRELVGQSGRIRRLGVAAVLGGLTGAGLLLLLPESVFFRLVPILIIVACVLVALQPRITAALAARTPGNTEHSTLLAIGVYLTAVYGGYFGAAQGVILISILAILVVDDLQRLNGLKNVLVAIVNGVAAVVFILVAPVSWPVVALIAIGSVIGGQLGAIFGRRLRPNVLRAGIVVVGMTVAIRLLLA